MRLYRIPHSTNVERVALALAYKGIDVESVWVDPSDRTPVRDVSGQDLVPVLELDDGSVVHDSMQIVSWLDANFAEPPLYPGDLARYAEMHVFVEWFNLVWKGPPNEIEAELRKDQPDEERIEALSGQMAAWLPLFDSMLARREYLMGDEFSAADCAAFPFLKYGLLGLQPDDEELFHRILAEHQPVDDRHPRLADWIRRVDERPRA